ncbi:hypothetical protein Rxycam_00113 [Rubrobacter xylanophilus DSM 9941]|uniref:PQQ-dependent sugar dehydrogenase n=1 Tax=Rubrobacter xylanophilus TaxID=49319 RepID=UPI001C6418FB|nr:PQQ-dependent sugar dehydrogenase [Rubrobacter xylanophilus]QYJ14317.1 hypothetical protein Rxycam_00113 [Rubrobacter xylanophilus DSM 9941]
MGRLSFVGALAALSAVLCIAVLCGEVARGAAVLPAGFVQSRLATELDRPTAMALAPDGRLFVAQQGGQLRVIRDGRLLRRPVLAVRVDDSGERGLLGVALDPGFSRNHWVYIYYTTANPPVHNRIVRFTLQGDRASPGSGRLILRLDNLSDARNHNGGALHFGGDGRLYVAVGDNADGENAQSLQNLKGKVLRINRDGLIPRDNPFYQRTSGKARAIWALGLRNPFSFAVRPGTGTLFINDVGQNSWEEINRGRAGANYGWPRFEGPESSPRFTPPIFAYRHGRTASTGCAITGGAFYAPQRVEFPAGYVGDYFFADYCGGWIRRYDPASDRALPFASGISAPVDLLVGRGGALYYLERGTGSVYRVRYAGGQRTSHPW